MITISYDVFPSYFWSEKSIKLVIFVEFILLVLENIVLWLLLDLWHVLFPSDS